MKELAESVFNESDEKIFRFTERIQFVTVHRLSNCTHPVGRGLAPAAHLFSSIIKREK